MNSPSTNLIIFFSVYVAGQVLKRLLQQHPDKVKGQEALSAKKAELIYQALDTYPDIYTIYPQKSVRSRMNICFNIRGGDPVDELFLKESSAIGLAGLKGYRDLKGIRASNYNSVSLEGAQKLADFIHTFAKQLGNQ